MTALFPGSQQCLGACRESFADRDHRHWSSQHFGSRGQIGYSSAAALLNKHCAHPSLAQPMKGKGYHKSTEGTERKM